MNPQGTIKTTIPDIKSARRSPFRGKSDLTKWNTSRHDTRKIENPVCNDIKKNAGPENVFEVENFERKNSNFINTDLTYSN